MKRRGNPVFPEDDRDHFFSRGVARDLGPSTPRSIRVSRKPQFCLQELGGQSKANDSRKLNFYFYFFPPDARAITRLLRWNRKGCVAVTGGCCGAGLQPGTPARRGIGEKEAPAPQGSIEPEPTIALAEGPERRRGLAAAPDTSGRPPSRALLRKTPVAAGESGGSSGRPRPGRRAGSGRLLGNVVLTTSRAGTNRRAAPSASPRRGLLGVVVSPAPTAAAANGSGAEQRLPFPARTAPPPRLRPPGRGAGRAAVNKQGGERRRRLRAALGVCECWWPLGRVRAAPVRSPGGGCGGAGPGLAAHMDDSKVRGLRGPPGG